MKLPVIHPSNESKTFASHESLKHLCKNVVGIDRLLVNTDDKQTIAITTRTRKVDEQIQSYMKSIEQGPMRARLKRFVGRSGDYKKIKPILDMVNLTEELLVTTTRNRSDYMLLCSVALSDNRDTIQGLSSLHKFTGKWSLEFEQLDAWHSGTIINHSQMDEATRISAAISALMAESALTLQGLREWWRTSHLDMSQLETLVWYDMRVIARKVIYVVDGLVEQSYKTKLGFQQFRECVTATARAVTSIITFIDAHLNETELMRPCIQLFAKFLYVLHQTEDLLEQSKAETLRTLLALVYQMESLIEQISNCISTSDPSQEQSQRTISPTKRDGIRERKTEELKRLKLDLYDIQEEHIGHLGDGSFGVVWSHKARAKEAEYAIKWFRRDVDDFDDERIWNHIIREAKVWSSLKSEHINELLGFCMVPGQPYPGLVTHVCIGKLSVYCNLPSVETDLKLSLLHDVASGLNYLHTHDGRYAHGDLRPDNVLVRKTQTSPRPFAVLTDFGVADMAAFDLCNISCNTSSQVAPETYLAPEFCKDLPSNVIKVSSKADIYAFGCVFALVICNVKKLYENVGHKIRRLKEDGIYPVEKEKMDEPYRKFVCDLWNKDPDKRPPASELLPEINRFIVAVRSAPFQK